MNKQVNYNIEQFYNAIKENDVEGQIKFWSYIAESIEYSKQELIDSLLDDMSKGKDVNIFLESISKIEESQLFET